MKILSVVLLALSSLTPSLAEEVPTLAPIDADAEFFVPDPQLCMVCGEGKTVTNVNTELQLPEQNESTTCGALHDLGKTGQIDMDQCAALPDLTQEVCGCTLVPEPGTFPECHVCGEGKQITDFTKSIVFPGHPSYTCEELDEAGRNGQLEESGCSVLPSILEGICKCQPVAEPSSAPSVAATSPAPTPSPTLVPTTAGPSVATVPTSQPHLRLPTAAPVVSEEPSRNPTMSNTETPQIATSNAANRFTPGETVVTVLAALLGLVIVVAALLHIAATCGRKEETAAPTEGAVVKHESDDGTIGSELETIDLQPTQERV